MFQQICNKGMIPIEKNIDVVDEQGNIYEATYPGRAKGLVKKGRARFIGENMICLACPPDLYLEDIKMNDDINNDESKKTAGDGKEHTLEYIMSRIDSIINNDSHIHEAIAAIRNMEVNEGMNNVDGDKARGDAIASAVNAREATNQQMIRLLEKMYDDLDIPRSHVTDEIRNFEYLMEALRKHPDDASTVIIKRAAQQIFVKPGASIVL